MNMSKLMKEKHYEIELKIVDFCEEHLDEEYAIMSLNLLEKLYQERPCPILKGKPNVWACGIVYTIGSANLLFDKMQTPYMKATDLAEKFGVGQSVAGNKASAISRLFDITPLDPVWTLPSKLKDNPLVWMIETKNGFAFDTRNATDEIKRELLNYGLAPPAPTD